MLGAVVGSMLASLSYSAFGIAGLALVAFASSLALVKYRDTPSLVEMSYAVGALALALTLRSLLNFL